MIKKPNNKNNEIKSKHNFWINGLEKGSNFFHYIRKLGSGLFYVVVFITCLFFWSLYYISVEDLALSQIGLFFILMFRLVMYLVVGGLLFEYFCFYLSRYLSNREEKKILNVGVKKYLK